jgi:hypothetical protein
VDDTVEYARKGMEGFKKEEQAVIQEMRAVDRSPRLLNSTFNFKSKQRN